MSANAWLAILFSRYQSYRELMGYNEKKGRKKVNQRIAQKKSVGLNDFLLIIRSEWENLDLDLLSNLCAGMKKRLKDVIEKKGHIIDH